MAHNGHLCAERYVSRTRAVLASTGLVDIDFFSHHYTFAPHHYSMVFNSVLRLRYFARHGPRLLHFPTCVVHPCALDTGFKGYSWIPTPR